MNRRTKKELEDELYDCVPQDLFNFLELLNNQATEFHWSDKFGIMMIPKDVVGANMDYVNLITNHGEINLNITIFFKKHISERNREQHKIQIRCIIA